MECATIERCMVEPLYIWYWPAKSVNYCWCMDIKSALRKVLRKKGIKWKSGNAENELVKWVKGNEREFLCEVLFSNLLVSGHVKMINQCGQG